MAHVGSLGHVTICDYVTICSKIKPFFQSTLITHPETVLHAMLCSGDDQERNEAVQRIVKLRREGDEETQLGGGGGGKNTSNQHPCC